MTESHLRPPLGLARHQCARVLRKVIALTIGRFRPTLRWMTGNEFIRRVKALGKARGLQVVLDASRGKESHQTLYLGSAFTVIRNPKDELKTGTFRAMCTQLGIKPDDL